jgi:PAS domain S-box-containing protein
MGNPIELSIQEIESRKRWLGIGKADEAVLAEIDKIVGSHIPELMTAMYSHFLSFPETRSFFPDEATVNRARSAQTLYFERLIKGNYDEEYVRGRLTIGTTHHRIDLDPKWYLGAYAHAIAWLTNRLAEHYSDDAASLAQAVSSLTRIMFFDVTLAMDTYIGAKELALTKHISALKDLETERKATKAILESAPIGILRYDADYYCVECNPEFMSMVGAIDRKELIGKSLFQVAPGLNREPYRELLMSAVPTQRFGDSFDFFSTSTAGANFWDWACWPIKEDNGAVAGYVAKFVNVSDRILLQQQREDFVATLTHDLKTPILAAARAIKLLLEGDFGAISAEQAEILRNIHESNDSLYKLVQTLLDVYKYESGTKQLNFTPVFIDELVLKVLTEIRSLAEAKGIRLVEPAEAIPQKILCDREEVRRVLMNLVDNALKFTPSGGLISVTISQTPRHTTVSVQDTGKGVKEEDQGRLFQRFWQASGSGKYYAGTGLGLYLCRKIVEMHGGKISCTSTPSEGSTFTFTLPNNGQPDSLAVKDESVS